MKIIYNIAATYNSGGMERVLANKANYLVDKGHEVLIITTDQQGRDSFFKFDSRIRFIDLDINYESNNGKSIFNKLLKYPFKQRLHRKRLDNVLKKERAEIVVSMFCNDVSFINDISDGSKKILEIHFSKYKRLQYARKGLWYMADLFRSWQDELLVRKFDKFIVLTEEDRSYWGETGNIEVIPNARSFNAKHCSELKNKKIIAVGRYTHQKGFDLLIKSWRKVCENVDDWHLDIVGNGELGEELSIIAKDNCLTERISFVKPTDEIDKVYTDASVLVMSSRYEGLPMVLLEAQAFGLPIVSFKCKCGPSDIIRDGIDGYLIDENNIDGLSEAITKIIKDEGLRRGFGKEALKNSNRFDEHLIMNQWITLFEAMAN